ncbi:MAG TPA: TetR/AcrR family transcriptional regulator, partial [Silvibacterium sp.]|nr:TetR/AcrR family transcriptional regulator [Silvibacterium sp.]
MLLRLLLTSPGNLSKPGKTLPPRIPAERTSVENRPQRGKNRGRLKEHVVGADVAAAAGVARATVFNHFGSKHALLEAITEEVIARYSELLQHALADTTTPTPALVRALFALIGGGIEEDRRF